VSLPEVSNILWANNLEVFMYFKRAKFMHLLFLFMGLIAFSNLLFAEQSRPPALIEEASTKLQKKLQDTNIDEDFNELTKYVNELIKPMINFDLISSYVLGKHWELATPDQKERFTKEFQTLLVRTYSRAFMEFKDWKIRYLPLQMESNTKKVVVKTEVLQTSAPPISVNYRMVLTNGDWKVYDIMIEGVSLVTNYRTSFNSEIQSRGSLKQ
jgi:phospholipid transport system substrate-binding protein